MDIRKLSTEILEDGTRLVTITAAFGREEDLEADDVATLSQALDEINGAVGSRAEPEEEADPPKPRRRAAAKKEEAAEPEEKKPATRRRAAAKTEDTAEEEPEKPTRRRAATQTSTTTSPSDEAEAEPEAEPEKKPTRRRAAAKKEPEFDGPSKEDVAKMASEGVLVLEEEIMTEIICEHSDTGKLDDIVPESRQAFIDAVNFELDAPEGE